MRLHYYTGLDHVGHPNFGDELNRAIWPHYFGGLFDATDRDVFLGIGTLLNSGLDRIEAERMVVFGAGVGYGVLPRNRDHWDIRFVRGPLSAKELGIDTRLAITDPGTLVREHYRPSTSERYAVSYLPHFSEMIWNRPGLTQILGDLDIRLIDLRDPIENVINQIVASEFVLCEAMHGAIVADSYRVPWAFIKTKADINEFKWNDWAASLGIDLARNSITRAFSIQRCEGLLRRLDCRAISWQFKRLLRQVKPQLSAAARLNNAIDRMHEEIHQLQQQYV